MHDDGSNDRDEGKKCNKIYMTKIFVFEPEYTDIVSIERQPATQRVSQFMELDIAFQWQL